ncbi:MAG: hypothetical protein JWQ76_2061, partial [Ramlibacter sp.]|nr:hypothetical protein [Ramlibacter sp.]
IIDLTKIDDFKNKGSIKSGGVVKMDLPNQSNLGRGPNFLAAAGDAGEFLLTNSLDPSNGLVGLDYPVTVNPDGSTSLGKLQTHSVPLKPADAAWLVRQHQLNVQRANGVVFAMYGGEEYALVADYNFIFESPHFGNETMFGKQIGGKIGIVKDPLGKKGQPQYMGATTPIPGVALDKLAVSPNGKMLMANGFVEEMGGPDSGYYSRMYQALFVWDLEGLLKAAVDARADATARITHPIDLKVQGTSFVPRDRAQPQRYNTPGGDSGFAWIYGMAISDDFLFLTSPTSQAGTGLPTFTWTVGGTKIEKATLYVSTKPPGQGLFPNDPLRIEDEALSQKVQKAINDWFEQDVNANRILTKKIDITSDGNYTFTLPADARLTAGQTYYWGVEVTDADGEVRRKSATFKVAPVRSDGQTFPSVTVITHGFQPPIISPDNVRETTAWEIAVSMQEKSGATVLILNKASGEFERADRMLAAIDYTKPLVLLPNWIVESGISDSGFAEASASAIYAAMEKLDVAYGGKLFKSSLHFIGHSRGASVNSEVIQRIGTYHTDTRNIQMTMLDPHDFVQQSLEVPLGDTLETIRNYLRGASIAGTLISPAIGAALFSMSSVADVAARVVKFAGLAKVDFADFKDPNVQVWPNVTFADNYYQTLANQGKAKDYQSDLPASQRLGTTGGTGGGFTFTPNGRPVVDADINIRLDGRAMFKEDKAIPLLGIGMALPHSRVQSWYSGTANLAMVRSKDLPFDTASYVWRTLADYQYQQGESSIGLPWYRFGETKSLASNYSLTDDLKSKLGAVPWEGIGTGWAWSVQGGGGPGVWSATGSRTVTINFNNTEFGDTSTAVPTVFNGDFQSSQHPLYGRFPIFVPTWTEIPGWSFQGGSGGALQAFDLSPRFTTAKWTEFIDSMRAKGYDNVAIDLFTEAWDKLYKEMVDQTGKILAQGTLSLANAGAIADQVLSAMRTVALSWAINIPSTVKSMTVELLKFGPNIRADVTKSLGVDVVLDLFHFVQSNLLDYAIAVSPDTPVRHDWMYFPPGGSQLRFDYKIASWDPDSVLQVTFESAGSALAPVPAVVFQTATLDGAWRPVSVQVPESLRGKAGRFTLSVFNGPANVTLPGPNGTQQQFPIRPEVIVDNLRVVGAPAPLTVEGEGSAAVTAITAADIEPLLAAAKALWLAAGAAPAALDRIQVALGDLGGNAVAATQDFTITVDAVAAGHGWFLDGTPMSSEEYAASGGLLLALSGSEAGSRVDLLTALAHEIGHALGLEHSDDGHDLMAATLQPGMRQVDMHVYNGTFGSVTLAPAQAMPARAETSIRTAAGTVTAGAAGVTQHLTLANPTLLNGALANPAGWSQSGQVTIAAGAATLGESAQAQARLSQAFVMDSNDSFLTFTVAGAGLRSNGNTAQDAFEVALLDAVTGQSLLGGIGLTHSDAALNLQANAQGQVGTRRSGAVSSRSLADGSTSYTLDLRSIAAGTIVNLSFDLIGFGPATSELTLKDVRLVGAPEAADDVVSVLEDGSLVAGVLGNDTNAHLPGYSAQIVSQAAHGSVTLDADGTFIYLPDADYAGDDSFSYRIAGAAGDESSNVATVHITVTPVNDAPVAAAASGIVAEDGSATIALSATDIDNTAFTWRVTAQPKHGTVTIGTDGVAVYKPATDFFGTDTFSYVANDRELDSAAALVSITVTSVNDAPVAQDATASLDEDGSRIVDLRAFGLDIESSALEPVIDALPAHGSFTLDADGSYTYTPDANYNGIDTVRFALRDGEGLVGNVATLTLTIAAVNDAPTLANQTASGDEDHAISGDLLATAADTEGSALTASIVAGPAHGSVDLHPDGSFTYTPDANYYGPDSFTYRVSDGELESDVATVAIDVRPVNDEPTLADSQLVVEEEAPLLGTLQGNAGDIDSATLSFSVVAGPAHGFLEILADGNFRYRGYGDYNGPDSFTYVVSDGEAESRVATVSIDVTPFNDDPIANDALAYTREDELLILPLRSYGYDVDDASIDLVIIGLPAHGSLWENADGTFSYQPDANFNGLDFVYFLFRDGEGATSSVCKVRITVDAVNDRPALLDQDFLATEDTPLSGNLLASASDVEGGALTAELVAGPIHGSVTFHPDGTFSYQGEPDFNGGDSFVYRVNDGELDSRLAVVTITVGAVNDLPVATDARIVLLEDEMAAFDLRQFGTDVEGTPLTPRIVSGPLHGTLALNADGSYTYLPAPNYYGYDSMRYVLADGEGVESNEATLAFTVMPDEDMPTLGDQSLTLAEDGLALGNMMDSAADVEGMPLAAVLVDGPTHGVLHLNANGSFSYTPGADYFGGDSFTVRVSDGQLMSRIATVSFTVTPVNDAPIAHGDSVVIAEDSVLTGNVLDTASDVDSAALTAELLSGPQHGTLALNANGTFSYTPNLDYHGSDSFSYRVSDGELYSMLATTFQVQVRPRNDTPVAHDAPVPAREDVPLVIDFRSYGLDVDNDADTLVPVILGAPAHGTLVANSNGTYTYTPAPNFNGADEIRFALRDFAGATSNEARLSIVVESVNDVPVLTGRGLTVAEDDSVFGNLLASASDVDGDYLEIVVASGPAHGTLWGNSAGTFNYTPDPDYFGADSFTYLVSDGQSQSVVVTVAIEVTPVNDAPVAHDGHLTMAEDGLALVLLEPLVGDIDGPALTITAGSALHGTVIRDASGAFFYRPDADFHGTDSFTYTVSDGSASATATMHVDVLSVNDPPVAVGEAVDVERGKSVTIDVLANDRDVETPRAGLVPVILAGPAHGSVTVNANGTVTYVPLATYSGSDSFQYVVSDGALQSAAVTVQINVIVTNRDPSFVSTPPASIALATAYAGGDSVWQVSGSTGKTSVSYTLTQRNGSYKDEVGYFIVDDAQGRIGNLRPGDAGYAAAALSQERATSIFAGSNAEGITHKKQLTAGQFTGFYLIQDSSLGNWRTRNGANQLGSTPLAFFSFAQANPDGFDHLRAGFDTQGMLAMHWEDLTNGGDQDFNDMVINVAGLQQAKDGLLARLDYDSDATDPDGDTLTYSLAQAPQGASIDAATGRITWATTAVGSYSFSVLAADDKGGVATQSFTLTVRGPNHAPVANADTASGLEDTTVRVNVLANDTDADGDHLTAEIVAGPLHGAVSGNTDGSFNYRPELNWSGTDSFSYRVTDGTVASAPTTVKVTIAPVNDAPVAPDLSYTVQKDGSVRLWLDDMVSDVDSECLTIAVTKPSRGTLTRNCDGSYTYRPAAGFVGLDGFGYTVSDGRLSASGTVTLDVQPRPPVAGCDNSATITVPLGSGLQTVQWAAVKYVLLHKVTGSGSGSGPDVDWTHLADPAELLAAVKSTQDWLVQLLGATGADAAVDPAQLAQLTGLRLDL